jgi:hypothetical protein
VPSYSSLLAASASPSRAPSRTTVPTLATVTAIDDQLLSFVTRPSFPSPSYLREALALRSHVAAMPPLPEPPLLLQCLESPPPPPWLTIARDRRSSHAHLLLKPRFLHWNCSGTTHPHNPSKASIQSRNTFPCPRRSSKPSHRRCFCLPGHEGQAANHDRPI